MGVKLLGIIGVKLSLLQPLFKLAEAVPVSTARIGSGGSGSGGSPAPNRDRSEDLQLII